MAVIPGGLAGSAQGMQPRNWGAIANQRRDREERARQYDNANKLAALKSLMGSTPPRIYFKQNPGAWKSYVEASGFGAGEAQKMWDSIMSDDSPATFDELLYSGQYSQIGPNAVEQSKQDPGTDRRQDRNSPAADTVVEASQTTTSTDSTPEPEPSTYTAGTPVTPPSVTTETTTEGETKKSRTAILGTGARAKTGYDFERMTDALLGPDAWNDDTVTNEMIVRALERDTATPLAANDRKILSDYINAVRSDLKETGEASEAILQYPDIKRLLDKFTVKTGEDENIDRPTGSAEPTTSPPEVTRNEENIVDYFTPLVEQEAQRLERGGMSTEAARKTALNEVVPPSESIDRNGEYTVTLGDGTKKVLTGNEAYGLRNGLYHNIFTDNDNGGAETQPWWDPNWSVGAQSTPQPGQTEVTPTEPTREPTREPSREAPARQNVGGTESPPSGTRLSPGAVNELSSPSGRTVIPQSLGRPQSGDTNAPTAREGLTSKVFPGGTDSRMRPRPDETVQDRRSGTPRDRLPESLIRMKKKPEVAQKKFEATERKLIDRTEAVETLPEDAKPAEVKRAVKRYSDAAEDYVSLSELTRTDDGRPGLMENAAGRESLRSAFKDTYERPEFWAALAAENAQYLPQYQVALQRQAQVNGDIQLNPVTDAQLRIEQAKARKAEADAKKAGLEVKLKDAELEGLARKTNNDIALAKAQEDLYNIRVKEIEAKIEAAKEAGNKKEEASLREKVNKAEVLLEQANALHESGQFEAAAEMFTDAYSAIGSDIVITPRNFNFPRLGRNPYEVTTGGQIQAGEINEKVDAAKEDDETQDVLERLNSVAGAPGAGN